MSDCKIIKAEASDSATICDLHKLAWEEAFSKDFPYPSKVEAQSKWEASIKDSAITVHLAVSGESRFGFVAHVERDGSVEITDLFVALASRGNGSGKALISTVIECCNSPIQLWVAEANSPAINLYRSLGFSTTTRNRQEIRLADKGILIEMYRKGGV